MKRFQRLEHPNFFVEYPLVDIRATFWIWWKYRSMASSMVPQHLEFQQPERGDKWPKSPWVDNTFGKYNGDGYLLYPGAGGKPYSSIRLEAFRDGLEDYEYLWTLSDLLKKAERANMAGPQADAARKLLTIDTLVKESGAFETEAPKYASCRKKVAEAIVAQKALDPK